MIIKGQNGGRENRLKIFSLGKLVSNMHIRGCIVKMIGKKIIGPNWFSEDRMPDMAYGWLEGTKEHILCVHFLEG